MFKIARSQMLGRAGRIRSHCAKRNGLCRKHGPLDPSGRGLQRAVKDAGSDKLTEIVALTDSSENET